MTHIDFKTDPRTLLNGLKENGEIEDWISIYH